jgi:GNAT superfamily N-acetyltransferase
MQQIPLPLEGVLFRRFDPSGDDQAQMAELVYSNAFLGQPFDSICPCKRWFSDIVLGSYIEHQPENIHVAVDQNSGRLIAYLTGSTGGSAFEEAQYRMARNQVARLAASLAMPWNFMEPSFRSFATHVIYRAEKERPSHPEGGVHWHFQVAKGFRERGIGTELFRRFQKDALHSGFKLVWAEVMGYREKPRSYFERHGWGIYDARPTSVFGNHVDFPVEVLCITRPLPAF